MARRRDRLMVLQRAHDWERQTARRRDRWMVILKDLTLAPDLDVPMGLPKEHLMAFLRGHHSEQQMARRRDH